MSVRFNSTGTQLLALRRRLPPVLYELQSRLPSFQFDNQGYFNSCTMKSCCFAGDKDQVGLHSYAAFLEAAAEEAGNDITLFRHSRLNAPQTMYEWESSNHKV